MKLFSLIVVYLLLNLASCKQSNRTVDNVEDINNNTQKLAQELEDVRLRLAYIEGINKSLMSIALGFDNLQNMITNFLTSFFKKEEPGKTDDIDGVLEEMNFSQKNLKIKTNN